MTRIRLEPHLLADDGVVPNNPAMALIVYRAAFDPARAADIAQTIEAHFASHGWGNAWVNGIYDFHHYHATAHEVLGLARGWAEVQFGGASGPLVRVEAGDVVFVPAGVAHCRKGGSADLAVVGAYPGGVVPDLKRALPADHARAAEEVARVPPPATDPVLGAGGPATRTVG